MILFMSCSEVWVSVGMNRLRRVVGMSWIACYGRERGGSAACVLLDWFSCRLDVVLTFVWYACSLHTRRRNYTRGVFCCCTTSSPPKNLMIHCPKKSGVSSMPRADSSSLHTRPAQSSVSCYCSFLDSERRRLANENRDSTAVKAMSTAFWRLPSPLTSTADERLVDGRRAARDQLWLSRDFARSYSGHRRR